MFGKPVMPFLTCVPLIILSSVFRHVRVIFFSASWASAYSNHTRGWSTQDAGRFNATALVSGVTLCEPYTSCPIERDRCFSCSLWLFNEKVQPNADNVFIYGSMFGCWCVACVHVAYQDSVLILRVTNVATREETLKQFY